MFRVARDPKRYFPGAGEEVQETLGQRLKTSCADIFASMAEERWVLFVFICLYLSTFNLSLIYLYLTIIYILCCRPETCWAQLLLPSAFPAVAAAAAQGKGAKRLKQVRLCLPLYIYMYIYMHIFIIIYYTNISILYYTIFLIFLYYISVKCLVGEAREGGLRLLSPRLRGPHARYVYSLRTLSF